MNAYLLAVAELLLRAADAIAGNLNMIDAMKK